MTTKSADWARARALCPPEDYFSQEWRDHYTEHPDVLTTMLGDLYRVYKSEEAKRNGTANPQGGRRKSHIDGHMDELWAIITPRFSVLPFREAFEELKGKRTYAQVAQRAGMNRRRLSGLLIGTINGNTAVLGREDLEALAKALDVHPAYFREWRTLAIQSLLADVFARSPHLSITMLKGLSR